MSEGTGGTRSGATALVDQLRSEGIEVIFGLPGDQLMAALDALHAAPDIRYIVARHEQGTTYMADGYARAGERPGVAMVVPGVGVYNAASGLATAYATSSPVLLVAGQVNRDGIGAGLDLLHDIHDQLDIVRPITKFAERVVDADCIPSTLRAALAAMGTGRPRPAHVEIPPETLVEPTAAVPITPPDHPPATADDDLVRRAAALLAGAERPLIVAGGGATRGTAPALLGTVAAHLQAAVVTTREGKGAIDDRDPLAVGTMWVNRRLRPVLDDADAVLAVGTRLQGFGFAPSIPIVHIDADAEQIGRLAQVIVGLAGDAGAVLSQLLDTLRATSDPAASRAAELGAARESARAQLRAIGPAAAIVEHVRQALPDDTIIVPDTTTVAYMCHMYLPVYWPRTYLPSSYMGTLGFAYPTALGAKVARPDRPVVALVGDGGFLFAATELATAMQHGIHTVTVVFNDSAYGNSNRDQRERFGGREIGTVLENPDFAALAAAFGATGLRVADAAELEPVLREAVTADTSVVIECPIPRLPSPF